MRCSKSSRRLSRSQSCLFKVSIGLIPTMPFVGQSLKVQDFIRVYFVLVFPAPSVYTYQILFLPDNRPASSTTIFILLLQAGKSPISSRFASACLSMRMRCRGYFRAVSIVFQSLLPTCTGSGDISVTALNNALPPSCRRWCLGIFSAATCLMPPTGFLRKYRR